MRFYYKLPNRKISEETLQKLGWYNFQKCSSRD